MNAGEGIRTPDGTNPPDLESGALTARQPPLFKKAWRCILPLFPLLLRLILKFRQGNASVAAGATHPVWASLKDYPPLLLNHAEGTAQHVF